MKSLRGACTADIAHFNEIAFNMSMPTNTTVRADPNN